MSRRGKRHTETSVLFLGGTQGTSTSVFYFSNLLKLGCAVYPFDPDPFRADNLYHRAYLKWKHVPHPTIVQSAAKQIIELVRKNPFDLIFVMQQNFVDAETLREIRHVSKVKPTIIYHSHDNNFYPGVLAPNDFSDALREYDHVFTTKSQNVERYRALGQANAHFIPSAFESTLHTPIPEGQSRFEKPFDVTFVGTYDRSRDPYVEAIGWHRLNVWGDHWKRAKFFSLQASRIQPRGVYFKEYADILSRSRISLGLLREEASDRHTQRTFEIPACGAMQIAPREPELLQFFKEDKEIVCFSSPEELRDKVDYYLKHAKAREAIASRGHARVLRDGHTYLDRVSKILSVSLPSLAKKAA